MRREPCKAVEAPENVRPALRAARQAGGSVRTARSWAYVRSLDTPLQSSTPRITQQGQTLGAPPGWEPPWLLPSPSLLDPGPLLLRLLAPPSDWVSSGGGCSADESATSTGATSQMCGLHGLLCSTGHDPGEQPKPGTPGFRL